MKKNIFICILFFLSFSSLYSNTNLDYPSVNIPNLSPPDSLRLSSEFNNTYQFFIQKRYNLFLKEINMFQTRNTQNPNSNDISLFKAIALFQNQQIPESKELFVSLTNITNLNIKHQALLYLYEISKLTQQNGINYLNIIQKASIGTPYKEIAHSKLIYHYLDQKNFQQANILTDSFEQLYPDSIHLNEIQYFIALNNLQYGNTIRARIYAKKVLETRTNIKIQRLLGELALQENKLEEALEYFVPIAKTYNPYTDEALYKSALLYKKQKKFQEAHQLLTQLLTYHKSSPYATQAFIELANVNISLKNYDSALIYYLQQSRKSGPDKAYALLKMTEIYFLESNSPAVMRSVNRIQEEFPYSTYANLSLYWMGRSYLLEKNYTEGIQTLEEYLKREPESPKKDEIQIFLGQAYANINNLPSSRRYFQNIVNQSFNEALKRQALLGLGQSYNKTESKRSLEYFDRIWKIWPNTPESEKALYYSAAIRYNLRLNNESLDLFKDFTTTYTNSILYPEAMLAIAKLEFKSENFNNIIDTSNPIITKNNQEQISELQELQARSFFRLEQYDNALPLFKESAKLTTNSSRKTDLFLAEASTLRALGRHKEAVKNYEQYLNNISPEELSTNELSELLRAEIAFSYLEIQNINKAKSHLEYIKTYYPKSKYISEIYFKIADEYFAKKQYTSSAENYAYAREFTTDSAIKSEALLREAWSRDSSNDINSKDTFQLFLKNYPNHFGVPDVTLKLAKVYEKQGNPDHIALRYKIINSYPQSLEAEEARNYFANQLSSKNTMEEFQFALTQTKDPSLQSKYLYKLGLKLKEEGNLQKSMDAFNYIHNLKDPELGALALFEIGAILSVQEKYQESLQQYINIIAQYDEKFYPRSLDSIIQTYILLEDFDNAKKFKDRLISQYPDSEERKKWN